MLEEVNRSSLLATNISVEIYLLRCTYKRGKNVCCSNISRWISSRENFEVFHSSEGFLRGKFSRISWTIFPFWVKRKVFIPRSFCLNIFSVKQLSGTSWYWHCNCRVKFELLTVWRRKTFRRLIKLYFNSMFQLSFCSKWIVNSWKIFSLLGENFFSNRN